MKTMTSTVPKAVILFALTITLLLFTIFPQRQSPHASSSSSSLKPNTNIRSNTSPDTNSNPNMAAATVTRSFILWLHGLGDSGPANEPIKKLFTSPEFGPTKWSFPSAPRNPVTCNYGMVMPSWFDIHEIPIKANSPKDESGLLKAVKNVHAMIDKEIEDGTDPSNVFVCGFSQGGALTLASVLLYPRTLGGGAVFSGWVPFNSSILDQIPPDAKKTPILWSHGTADQTVLFEAGQGGPPFLEQAGMSCEFKAYPGLGHSISNEELRYLESWIKTSLRSSS